MNGNIETAFTGRVGTDPELKTSQAAFNCAVGVGDDVQWVRVAVFGDAAVQLTGSLHKGDKAYVEGNLKLNCWIDREGKARTGLSVAAWKVEKLGQIGRSKLAKPKGPPEGEHPAPPWIISDRRLVPAARDWQRPAGDDAIPF